MPAERLSMRKVREVLRLKHALGMSYRKISEATGVSKTQAAEYVRRAEASGIRWPLPEGIDDAEPDRRLFPVASSSLRARPAGGECWKNPVLPSCPNTAWSLPLDETHTQRGQSHFKCPLLRRIRCPLTPAPQTALQDQGAHALHA